MAGPALASILAQVTAIVILLHSINKSLQLGIRKIFPYQAVLKALIIAILAGLPLLGIVRLEYSDGIILVIGASAFAVCYLPLALFFKVIHREDLRYLKGIITGKIMRRAR